ncbi:hypothetical protein SSTU70S_03812 [Stutzerimonas stutzeri]
MSGCAWGGPWSGFWGAPMYADTRTVDYQVGTLQIDFYADAADGKLGWRGRPSESCRGTPERPPAAKPGRWRKSRPSRWTRRRAAAFADGARPWPARAGLPILPRLFIRGRFAACLL